MKTLSNHVLIYDQDCPLCQAYTSAFIKTGMLDKSGREAYSAMHQSTCAFIDENKARNEIALVDTQTGNVTYGIDSLFKVLGHAFPILERIFRIRFFHWFMQKFYAFISYNRKVIIPGKVNTGSCIPDFSLKYRWAYIIFTWLCTSYILSLYSFLLEGLLPGSRFHREFIICGGQILFQSSVMAFIAKDKIMSYLGNMMTISFAGAILLLFIMFFGSIFHIESPIVYAGLFMTVAGLMFLEHLRRMKLLEIHWSASASWVLYRLLVLYVII